MNKPAAGAAAVCALMLALPLSLYPQLFPGTGASASVAQAAGAKASLSQTHDKSSTLDSATQDAKAQDSAVHTSGVFESTAGESAEERAALGLGNTFSFERLQAPVLDANSVSLEPNANPVAAADTDAVVLNGVRYDYDTTSGATVIASRSYEEQTQEVDPEVKAAHMSWTVQPPLGITQGEYYRYEKKFNEGPHQDKTSDDGYFLGTIDLVVDKGKTVHVELDEYPAYNYYNSLWASKSKKRSGYAFFQARVPRTNVTLVTTPNGQNFLEWQILHHNSLDLVYDTPYGNSNSARDVLIPAAKELAAQLAEPSGQYYLGIALPNGDGLTPWLQLVFEGKTLVSARYDEVFADRKQDIANAQLADFYRQSKYESVSFADTDGGAFRAWSDDLCEALLAQGTLDLSDKAFDGVRAAPEFAHVEALVDKIAPSVDSYLEQGYSHDTGSIGQRPEGMVERPDQIDRNKDLDMELVGTGSFNSDKTRCTYTLKVINTSDTDYTLDTGDFYLYVKNENNLFDTLADPDTQTLTIKAGSTETLSVTMGPIRPGDTEFNLRYDGANKVFRTFILGDALQDQA